MKKLNDHKGNLFEDRKTQPELSVIVPIYNAEQYLEQCLDSIIDQTFYDMEIILVNDGSTDGSLDICKIYQKKDSRIKVVSKENGGLIRARKTGLSVATGGIIGFVDSDDWIEADMYETLMRCMTENDCDMVSSGIIRDYKEPERSVIVLDHYKEGLYNELENSIYPTMLYDRKYRDFGLYCTLVNKIYKRNLLDEVYKDINEEVFYGEDALTCYQYCLHAKSIYILHKALYHYNIRFDSMASKADERLPYNNYLLYMGLENAFQNADCNLLLMSQLKKYMLSLERHNLSVLYQINAAALDEWTFSYPEEMLEKKFVLYGAGSCGQALYRKLQDEQKEKNMVYWVDKNADQKTGECSYAIKRPDVLVNSDWEVMLVAVQDKSLAEEIMAEAAKLYHIERERMFWSNVEHVRTWDIY